MSASRIVDDLRVIADRVSELDAAARKKLFRNAAKALDFWGTKIGVPTPEEANVPGEMAYDLRALAADVDILSNEAVMMLVKQAADEIERRQAMLSDFLPETHDA